MKFLISLICLFHLSFSQFEDQYKEALALEKSKNDAKAMIIYDQILSVDSNQIVALTHGANVSTQLGVVSNDMNLKLSYFYKAMDYSNKAMKVNPDYDEAYISHARAMGRLALMSETKQQLTMAREIKKNVDKAVELNPNNGIAWHILGKWYFKFADLSWFERSIAGLIYGSVPKATFKEAKSAFKKAMDIQPTFISHRLEYAKTCIKLDEILEAKSYLEEVLEANIVLSTDQVYKNEAKKLLADLN